MKKYIKQVKSQRSQEVYRLISRLQDKKMRNLLRGMSAKGHIYSKDAQSIRDHIRARDGLIVGALLKGGAGLYGADDAERKRTSAQLFSFVKLRPIELKEEIAYTAGYLNSMRPRVIELIAAIRGMAFIEKMPTTAALEKVLELARSEGASNFLSYKLAYLRSARDLDVAALEVIDQIECEICHKESLGLHFSALENLSSKISLFLVARRRISGFEGGFEGGFRKSISLSNFIPTPISDEDVSAFLLRATESSLIDSIYSLLIVFNLSDEFSIVWEMIRRVLSSDIFNAFVELQNYCNSEPDGNLVTDQYHQQNIDSVPGLDLYRISAAFLERQRYAKYRNKFDRVIGARLLAPIIGNEAYSLTRTLNDKSALLMTGVVLVSDEVNMVVDSFYRTYVYLRFIQDRFNIIELNSHDIRFVYENTLALESLLSESEMRLIYQAAPEDTKSLATVLALALYRQKAVDPDVDFEFRADFVDHVINNHDGSILNFIESLLTNSPAVANYIVGSLDEVTLEKMYTLVSNTSQALTIRGDILRAVGKRLNRIDYFVEADAITTRTKVASLQQYFDTSRMYVDSVAMKRWLDSNPTVSTEQYRSLYSRTQSQIAALAAKKLGDSNIILVQVDGDEYLVSQIVKDAFSEFCLNSEFGIESYLGRRIRHNTLEGVMNEPVDAVLNNQEYRGIVSTPWGREAFNTWQREYRQIIERLRRERLQFKKSGALFSAELDVDDPLVREGVRQLANTLRTAGGAELLNELVISFCWKQIAPQLEKASRFIKTGLLNSTNFFLDRIFEKPLGALEQRMLAEMHHAINGVFKKVASWFQVPQTGFVSASIKELGNIIWLDMKKPLNLLSFDGDAIENKYTGMSVHRIYDCLAVLLMNAEKHSDNGAAVSVQATSSSNSIDAVVERVNVDVASVVSEADYHPSVSRIRRAIEQEEAGIDMVTEGFTGIKKIKFITKMNEGKHTVRVTSDDVTRQVHVSFSIHAELAKAPVGEADEGELTI